jgi:hypothetical protein
VFEIVKVIISSHLDMNVQIVPSIPVEQCSNIQCMILLDLRELVETMISAFLNCVVIIELSQAL